MKKKRIKILIFIAGLMTMPLLALAIMPDWIPSAETIRGCLTTKMYRVHLCPGSKNYVSLKQISPILQKTIVLTEDSSFFQHKGFDWSAIEKNAREGWATGSFKKGGSSISQQLAKNMFLTAERSFWRKAKEAIITDRIESTLNKNEILERYLNVIEFGKNVYGIKAASQFYFQKAPSQLDVVESSFLAMLLPNPVKYSQSYYKKELSPFAQKRMDKIIDDLYQYNRIDDEQYLDAQNKLNLFFKPTPPPMPEELQDSSNEGLSLEDLENGNFEDSEGSPE
jgi:monofunctional biosynthetic peptidoglycan transglycosylase